MAVTEVSTLVPNYPATNVSNFDVAEVYRSMQDTAENIRNLAYRYNTGIFLILSQPDDIQNWLNKLDLNMLPPIFTDFVVVYDNVVEHYVNNLGGDFDQYDYSAEGFSIEEYLTAYSPLILKPSDRLVAGPEEGTYWYAKTIWEEAEKVPVLGLNTLLVRQLYERADSSGIYDDYTPENYHNAEQVVDITVPIIAIFNPYSNWYDVLDGFHRLHKARWTNSTLKLKSIEKMPEPDFINCEITEHAMQRYIQRRNKLLTA